MLSGALRYPGRGDATARTLLVGGALVLSGSFLLVPLLPVLGYYVRVLGGADPPPRFEDWGGLVVDGLKATVIQILYVVPVALVGFLAFVAVGTFVLRLGSETGASGAVGHAGLVDIALGAAALGLAVLVLSALLLPLYLLPGALALFAREGRVAAAFAVADLRGLLSSTDYLVAWLLASVVFVVGGVASALLAVVLVGFVVQFYVGVVGHRLVARAVAEAT